MVASWLGGAPSSAAFVCGAVHTQRQPRHDSQAGLRQCLCEMACIERALCCWVAAANNGYTALGTVRQTFVNHACGAPMA